MGFGGVPQNSKTLEVVPCSTPLWGVELTAVRPAWAQPWRWKSSRNLVIKIEANRNCGRVTDRGKEAGSETVGRRTGIGYEAESGERAGRILRSSDDQDPAT